MSEAAEVLGIFAIFLLAAALAIWAGLLRGPFAQRLDGHRTRNARPSELVSAVLVAAVGMSALASVSAIIGMIWG